MGNSPFSIQSQSSSPIAGDFNNDGKPDFVLGGISNPGNGVDLVLGNGDGTFQKPVQVGTAPGFIDDIAVADVNRDGKLDIVSFDDSKHFGVFYCNGNGTFQAPLTFATPAYPLSGTVGNFFNDGYVDVALADDNGDIDIYRNEGGKNFVLISTMQSGAAGTSSGFIRVRAGDLNGNGIDDLGALTATGAYVLWNNGQGAFSKVLLSSYPSVTDLNVANVNQDGRADIVVSYHCGQSSSVSCAGLDIFYGQGGNKTFFRHAVTDPGPEPVSSVEAIDVNGDGVADLVASGGYQNGTYVGLFVWLGNADGSFAQSAQIFNAGQSGPIVAGDFNRDGAMDFVQYLESSDTVETYINGGQHGPCLTSQISPTVLVCEPVDNTYVQPVVSVQATVYDKNKTTAMQEYVDGSLDYSENVTKLDYTSHALSLGQHSLVTKAWNDTGLSFLSPRTVTVYNGTPGPTCPAAMGTANICMPSSASAMSPVMVLANGSTANIPTAAQLYIDGKLVVNNTSGPISYVQTSQTLAVGNHSIVFKLWDSQGNTYVAQKNITVQ